MEKLKINNYPIPTAAPAAIVGVNVEGKPNYVTIGANGMVCMKPVLYVSLKSTHYSTAGIKESGCFSVNIPSADLVQETDYCGMVSGKTTDKSTVFTAFYDDELQAAPLIKECPLNLLCKVVQSVPIFGFEVFFGEIVATYINEQCLTDGKPDPLKINPLMMMHPSYYSLGQAVGDVFKAGLTRISSNPE